MEDKVAGPSEEFFEWINGRPEIQCPICDKGIKDLYFVTHIHNHGFIELVSEHGVWRYFCKCGEELVDNESSTHFTAPDFLETHRDAIVLAALQQM